MFGEEIVRHLFAIGENGKVVPSRREEAHAWIEARQGNSNFYYSVNELNSRVLNRKATKRDVARALYLHVDVDDRAALSRICEFTPKPTAIVFSGGYQAFWKLREAATDLALVERINADLAQRLGGDKCHNVDRIMRLPGTVNVPSARKRRFGRVPTLAYVVEDATDWSRCYSLNDFGDPGFEEIDGATCVLRDVKPIEVDQLPSSVSLATIDLIKLGDDPSAPIGSKDAHFRSRSEAVWRVACELAHAECSPGAIAGILINPAHGISRSVLEKRNPNDYALRQAKQALSTVSSGWPDVLKDGRPKSTMRNAMLAMRRMGLQFGQDLFRHRKTVERALIQEYQGNLSDDACPALRLMIIDQFGFDVGKDATRDGAETLAISNAFHPIRNYLGGLRWDGMPRLNDCQSAFKIDP
jgi:RepB DNA-primase from phage plasmid